MRTVTGLSRDGAEPITTSEVNDAMYFGSLARANAARGKDLPRGKMDPISVEAQAIEAMIHVGSVIVGLMEGGRDGAFGRITLEQAAARMEWDPAIARRGVALFEADLSGYLFAFDVTAEPELRTTAQQDAQARRARLDHRVTWLGLEAAEIAAGIRRASDGALDRACRGRAESEQRRADFVTP